MKAACKLFAISLLAFIPSICPADSTSFNRLSTETITAIESLLEPTDYLKQPGFILSLQQHGQPLHTVTSGAADIEQGRAINSDTVFHIASLSKQITAAALAHAIMDGHVSLDDPVSRWIPETAKYGKDLSVAHLVYMTSGLTEYTDVPRPARLPWATFHYFDIDDAINASLSVDKLLFKPGTRWQYSNINYMLLTRIVASANGKPFSQVVAEKIFQPLKMTSALINDDITTIVPNRANAYLPREREAVNELRVGAQIQINNSSELILIRRNSPHYGGSGVMTSMADWNRWLTELTTRNHFGEGFWKLMLSTRRFQHDKTNDAFGLVLSERDGRNMIWYAGGDIDVSSYSATFPAAGISISCFSNDPTDSCRDKVQNTIGLLIDAARL